MGAGTANFYLIHSTFPNDDNTRQAADDPPVTTISTLWHIKN